jgi:aminopeptidase N
VINGKAWITTTFTEAASQIIFNLASVEEDKGMQTFALLENGKPLQFVHRNNELRIIINADKGSVKTFEVQYMGKPKDGLIISKNKYNERTFFADNWPNRAQHWIPCNDVPSDKASVEFIVTAPAHYKIISNGLLQEEKLIGNKKRTHWKEEVVIPTKVMVIGAANFAIARVDSSYKIPVTAWVYKQDSVKGTYDYALGDDILKFFESYIGPYPYKKLANVQSKTIFGGMENAAAIFYAENTVTGDRRSEALMAHEIAHQWFGNTATEKSFTHLWLSEGFATYLTHVYIEHKYGVDSFQKRLKKDREDVIAFAKQSKQPVVDSSSDYMDLLNANSYQKGGWILHMLRQEVGDKTFREIIKAYYNQYKFGNADTRDFQRVAEKVSGKDLTWFFNQWLYQPGVPILNIKYRQEGNELKLEIEQEKTKFKLQLPIIIIDAAGTVSKATIPIDGRETKYKLKGKGPFKVSFDPDVRLLYEEKK